MEFTQTELMSDAAIAEVQKSTSELFDLVANVPAHLLSRLDVKDLVHRRERDLKGHEESYQWRQKAIERSRQLNRWFDVVQQCLGLEKAVAYAWKDAKVETHRRRDDDPYMTVEIPNDKYTRTIVTIKPTLEYSVAQRGSWRSTTHTGEFIELNIDGKTRRYTIKDRKTQNWDKITDTITDEVERWKNKQQQEQEATAKKRNQFERTQDDFGDLMTIEKEQKGYYADSYRQRNWKSYEVFNGKAVTHSVNFYDGPNNDETQTYNISVNINKVHVDVAREILEFISSKLK